MLDVRFTAQEEGAEANAIRLGEVREVWKESVSLESKTLDFKRWMLRGRGCWLERRTVNDKRDGKRVKVVITTGRVGGRKGVGGMCC
jgi:hypothetical protein